MHPGGRNNPCGTKEPDRDASGRDEINIAEGPAFLELSLGEILNPTTFRIDPKGHWRAGYLQNKMPSRAERTIIRMGEGAAFRSFLQAR